MLTIHPYRTDREYRLEPYAELPTQLQVYLSGFSEYAKLRSLSLCDPYGDSRYSLPLVRAMRIELQAFEKLVLSNDVVGPPEFVGDSPGEPSEEFGMKGLVNFCRDLDIVLAKGIESGDGIVLIGD